MDGPVVLWMVPGHHECPRFKVVAKLILALAIASIRCKNFKLGQLEYTSFPRFFQGVTGHV